MVKMLKLSPPPGGLRFDAKAILAPSTDQAGEVSLPAWKVTLDCVPPVEGTVKISKLLFAARLLEKAIVEPNQAGLVSTPDDDVSRTFDGMDEEDETREDRGGLGLGVFLALAARVGHRRGLVPVAAAALVPLHVMLPRFWLASTKPGAALGRSQGYSALVRARVGSGAA
jgi:hypothetical protein